MLRRSTQNLLCALGFVGGIAIRSWFEIPLIAGFALACAGIVTSILGWKRERVRIGGLIALFLFLGIGRTDAALRPLPESDISHWAGQTVEVEGVVAYDPEIRLKTQKVVVEVSRVTHPPTPPKRGFRQVPSMRGVPEGRGVSEVSGKLLVIVPAVHAMEVGDAVQLKCAIEKPEFIEDFDYPRYLAKDGIYATCTYPEMLSRAPGAHGFRWTLARFKRDFQSSLNAVVPDPEGAFLGGILVGSRGRIPESVLDDFQRIGITHLIAISGYNITIIATGILALLTLFLRRHAAFPFLVLIIAAFTVMVGGSASVVRAAIMGLMLHAAYVSDRLYRPGYGLALAAAVMLAVNPRLLRDDLGFDLSFLATFGIMTLTPWFTRKFSWVTDSWHIREALAMTCAAQVTTLPLLVGSFDRVSLISPLANIIIVPMIPFVMALGFGAGITGIIPALGWIAGKAAWLASYIVLQLAHALARIPAASVTVPDWAWTLVVVAYGFVVLAVWQKRRVKSVGARLIAPVLKRIRRPARLMQSQEAIRALTVETAEIHLDDERPPSDSFLTREEDSEDIPLPNKGEGGGAGVWRGTRNWTQSHRVLVGLIIAVVVFVAVSTPSYLNWKRFSVAVFDVGQGDSILVSAPKGKQMLNDGGPDATVLSKLGRAMPWWDRTIELVVLTHPHADHATGLVEVLKRYKVRKVLMTGVTHDTAEYHAFVSEVATQRIDVQRPIAGDVLALGDVSLTVLYPFESLEGKSFQEPNDTSIVLKVEYGDASFLFTGDAGITVEPGLIERFSDELDVDVLKVGHQGSADASAEEFLNIVTPAYAVISVGENNSYGHPSPRIVKRLERFGARVLRTDKEGDVKFIVGEDGLKLKH